MDWPNNLKICKEENCYKINFKKGWCSSHYQKYYKLADDYKPIKFRHFNREHPLYIIWWQRKRDNLLSDSWLNFDSFIFDVSPKPEGNYFLIRIKKGLFGPDNFKWQEHLKRKGDESKKDWWARKRAARILANPSMESDRNRKRKFGLTKEQHSEMLFNQNGVCAICKNPETSVDGRNGCLRNLSVDHCHDTNKIRGLLYWRCNSTIGKLEENLDLFDKMKDYIIKHKGI